MADSDLHLGRWPSPFRVGSYTFSATLFVTVVTAIFVYFFLDLNIFLFGSGWVAPAVLAVLSFLFFVILKKIIFRKLYTKSTNDEDAALIEYLIQHHHTEKPLEEEVEMALLENALHLKQVVVRDCMTPLHEIIHIDVKSDIATLQQLFAESNLSRIVVINGDINTVQGYVHVQQLFDDPVSIKKMVMPIVFVPADENINELLNTFIKNRTNIACVTGTNGRICGLIALEDILEELFGDIDDEYDEAS